MGIRDWSSDVCSSELLPAIEQGLLAAVESGHRTRIEAVEALEQGEPIDRCRLEQLLVEGAVKVPLAPERRGEALEQVVKRAAAIILLLCEQGRGRQRVGQRMAGRGMEERSEEHTSELQSLMRISYAVFCLHKKLNRCYRHNNTLAKDH